MRDLLEFLTRNNHCFIFVILEVISFTLLFKFNSYQGSVIFSSANSIAGKIYEWDSSITNFFSMSQANKTLTKKNLELEQKVDELIEEISSLKKDTTLRRKYREQIPSSFRLINAKVISSTLNRPDNLLTINKGQKDGVKEDMGVASSEGVVGVVYMAGKHYSIVIPVLSSKSNLSVGIKNKGYFGHLVWPKGPSNIAYVNDIPRYAKFSIGDTIETNGYSQIFPKGIMVGTIIESSNSPDGLSYGIKIKLSTDFSRLNDVCVIDNSKMKERLKLMRSSKKSLKIKDE